MVDLETVAARGSLIRRWGRWRRLTDSEAHAAAEEWRHALRVRQTVRLERISRHQVVNERGRRGCGLVGVVYDDESARIYHTRAVCAEDLIHELLHVAYPTWTEEAVVLETARVVRKERPALRRTGLSAVAPHACAGDHVPSAGTAPD